MADPILLPDCPELRARAEAIARDRYAAFLPLLRPLGFMPYPWDDSAFEARACFVDAALAELRDLSTPTGWDHACRWLWALLTKQEPEWCPAWTRLTPDGFKLCSMATRYAYVIVVEPGLGQRAGSITEDFSGEWWIRIADVNSMTPTEAIAAAITAALDWRRSQP